jgi:hypothetical protein
MPHLLADRDKADVEAVLHYLGTLPPKNQAAPKKVGDINAEHGKALYHTKGCVACHVPRTDYSPPDGRPATGDFSYGASAFPALTEKYDVSTLAAFVRDPLASRPDGRMPRIEMEEQDTLDIAAYLLGIAGSDG